MPPPPTGDEAETAAAARFPPQRPPPAMTAAATPPPPGVALVDFDLCPSRAPRTTVGGSWLSERRWGGPAEAAAAAAAATAAAISGLGEDVLVEDRDEFRLLAGLDSVTPSGPL